MTDAGAGWYGAKILQRALPPPQKEVALLVSLELELRVQKERGLGPVFVYLHGVVDDEIDGLQRVDTLRITAEAHDRVAHGCEIDDSRDTGEILKQYPGSPKRDLALDPGLHVPACHRLDVVFLDEPAVLVSEEVLEQDLQAEGETVAVATRRSLQCVEAKNRVRPPVNRQRGTGAE